MLKSAQIVFQHLLIMFLCDFRYNLQHKEKWFSDWPSVDVCRTTQSQTNDECKLNQFSYEILNVNADRNRQFCCQPMLTFKKGQIYKQNLVMFWICPTTKYCGTPIPMVVVPGDLTNSFLFSMIDSLTRILILFQCTYTGRSSCLPIR